MGTVVWGAVAVVAAALEDGSGKAPHMLSDRADMAVMAAEGATVGMAAS